MEISTHLRSPRSIELLDDLPDWTGNAMPVIDGVEALDRRVLAHEMIRAIRQMPERTANMMRDWLQGNSCLEIGVRYGVTGVRVQQIIHRATAELRARFA